MKSITSVALFIFVFSSVCSLLGTCFINYAAAPNQQWIASIKAINATKINADLASSGNFASYILAPLMGGITLFAQLLYSSTIGFSGMLQAFYIPASISDGLEGIILLVYFVNLMEFVRGMKT